MQRGVAKGLKVPCLFMITEVSIRYQKTPEVGIRRIPPNTLLAICQSALHSRQITTPAPHHSDFYRPDALPAAQPKRQCTQGHFRYWWKLRRQRRYIKLHKCNI